jgi:hypothetical protein
MKIGIIGSAGRLDDEVKFTYEVYQRTAKQILDLCRELQATHIVSGGAAGIDHVAVSIFLKKCFPLMLHLPAEFDMLDIKFDGYSRFDAGKILNYYHGIFSKKLGRNSLLDIKKAIDLGATIQVTSGLKERNTKVAEDVDILIAATFGEGEKLKSGGTLDTWNKFAKLKPTNKKFHIDLHTNQLYPL